jgi:tyrosyl-tRNA synthetase
MFLKMKLKHFSLNSFKKLSFSSEYHHDNVIKHLKERGLINNISHPTLIESENIHSLLGKNVKMYIGFDPTAQSLHLGNLMGIMTALRFGSYGIDPVFLVGGATGLVGDPSGKKKERPLMSNETIQNNLEKIKENIDYIVENISTNPEFKKFINIRKDLIKGSSSDEETYEKMLFRHHAKEKEKLERQMQRESYDANKILLNILPTEDIDSNTRNKLVNYQVVDNYDFYKDLSVIDYLRKVGINMRMGSLLAKENVKSRLNTSDGMSLTEFLYQTMQGYDFLKLYESYNVKIQIGGSDQWGNMMAGNELVKKVRNSDVLCMTFPLLTTSTGEKFGKSEGNALFINPKLTTPNKIYQYFYNVSDNDIEKLLNVFTFLEKDEINEIVDQHKKQAEKRVGQKILAEKLTGMLFSEDEVKKCKSNCQAFYNGLKGDDLSFLDTCEKIEVTNEMFDKMCISKICMENKIFKTKSEFKRLLESGAIQLNDKKIFDDVLLKNDMFIGGKYFVLKSGKKNVHIFSLKQQ